MPIRRPPVRGGRVRSTAAGAALGVVAILGSAYIAIGATGHIPIFAANRGLLQLLVAVPAASLATAGCLAFLQILRPAQMLWAIPPTVVFLLVGAGVLGAGVRAWPWVLAAALFLFVPWITGALIGATLARRP